MATPKSPLLPADCTSFSSPDPAFKIFGKTILPLPQPSAIVSDNADESKSESDEDLSPRRIDLGGFSSGYSDGSDEDLPTLSVAKLDYDPLFRAKEAKSRTALIGFSSACSYAPDEDHLTFSKRELDEEGKNRVVHNGFSSACSYTSDVDFPTLSKGRDHEDAPLSKKAASICNIDRFGFSSACAYTSDEDLSTLSKGNVSNGASLRKEGVRNDIHHLCFSSRCESSEGKIVDDVPLSDKGGRNKEKKAVVGVEEKMLRKPDKPVPCPRCESMDTKFCYFNNYNLNQPRHFCRNCQRYWTAGGTLRNVPVGAGRRKNKHSSQHKAIIQDDTVVIRGDDPVGAQPPFAIPQTSAAKSSIMQVPQIEARVISAASPAANLMKQEVSFPGNTAVTFNPFAGLQAQKQSQGETETGCEGDVSKMSQGAEGTTKMKDECGSSVASSRPDAVGLDDLENGNQVTVSMGTASAAFPFFAMPWPYMQMSWTAAGAPAFPTSNPLWPSGIGTPPASANAPFLVGPAQGFWPWPSLPAAAWNPSWNVSPWGLNWGGGSTVAPTMLPDSATTVATTSAISTVNGPGKRLRAYGEGTGESSLYVPKSLRIHDPEEVAHSSILTTLGVDGKSESLTLDGICSAFQPKAEVFQPKSGSRSYDERHANPAAMSKSMAFQESNKIM